MVRRTLLFFVLVILGVVLGGCSADVGSGAPSVDDPGADLDQWLADNGIVKMVAGADGVEWGTASSGPDGAARFYSPAHKGMFELYTKDDKGVGVPGLRVMVGAMKDAASYLVLDDNDKYAPMVFNGPIDGKDQSGTVQGKDLQGANGDRYVFTPADNPFSSQFTLLGLSFTISIEAVMMAAAATVVGMVMKDLVENTCLFFEPLHHDACAIAGSVTADLASIAFAGIPMALEKGVGYAAMQIATEELPEKAASLFCGNVIGKNLIGWTKPRVGDAPETALETQLRVALYKYNYLLDQLDKSPPQDYTPAQQQELTTVGESLIALAQKVREGYIGVYNPEEMNTKGIEFGFETVDGLVGQLLKGRYSLTQTVSLTELEQALFGVKIGNYALAVNGVVSWKMQVPDESLEEIMSENKQKVAGAALSCVFAIATEAVIDYKKDGADEQATVNFEDHWKKALEIVDDDVTALYQDLYATAPPPPQCLPDTWEPNATWQQGVNQTIAGQISGSNTITLKNLNLCGADDDWYAYSAGPVNFSVGAAIRKPTSGVNTDKSVCVELYWYSEDYQIAGWDPDLISGPTCGTVDSEPEVPSKSVAGTMGESWRDILVHVYPDPNNGQTIPHIDYDLEVHP